MHTNISTVIDFGQRGNSQDYTLTGWSEVEPFHTWSIGESCSLCIDIAPAPFGLFIEIDWKPATRPPFIPSQTVEIAVNGRHIKSLSVDRQGIYAFRVQPLEPHRRRMVLSFRHPNAFAPQEFQNNRDARSIALSFRRLRILTITHPPDAKAVAPSALPQLSPQNSDNLVSQVETLTKEKLPTILHKFEMLAGNCDMGLALRSLSFEKMSLLRFAGATPDVAINGLETDFTEVGNHFEVYIADNPIKEWMVLDQTGLRFHTGQSSLKVTQAELTVKFPQYVRILKRKLCEDIAEGTKIFVYADHKEHSSTRGVEQALALFLALRRQSDSNLLWVCPSPNDPTRRGLVTEVLPGLAQANLDLFAPPILIGGGISMTGWLTVICNAWLVFKGQQDGK